MWKFKDDVVMRAVFSKPYDPTLVDIVLTVAELIVPYDVVITSAHRPGDSGVHGTTPCRGMDIRSRHLEPGKKDLIIDVVNNTWQYDPTRPKMQCCILHDIGLGEHFHLQVHPNTKRTKEAE